jgi:hypothetical protein
MQKTILRFGLLSGILSSVLMLSTVPFMDKLGHGSYGYLVGYTAIVLSFLLVYFGIRSYRDNLSGGHITFGRAFAVGILITLISCIFYVITWEIVYFNFMPNFMDNYGAHTLATMKAAGASAAAIQAKAAELEQLKRSYKNPFYNAAMTFMEPFPVGLLLTLLSAAVLRKKTPPQSAGAALPAS